MAATDNEIFMLISIGVMFGLLPFVIYFMRNKNQLIDGFRRYWYRDDAIIVKLIKKNKVTRSGIGRIDGNKIYFNGTRRPFDAKDIGLENGTSSIILFDDGRQVSLTNNKVSYPLTAEEYDNSIAQALMTGADNVVLKTLSNIRMFVILALGAAGISAYFTWQLVEKLI